MKQSRLVLVIILVAVAALATSLWVNEGPLWRILCTRIVPIPASHGWRLASLDPPISVNPERLRGWMSVERWSEPPVPWGRAVAYHLRTGYKAAEWDLRGNRTVSLSVWNEDGMLIRDFTTLFPTQRDVVTDQARPTAPWIKKQ